MSSIRDLYIGIHFEDHVTKGLNKIDKRVVGIGSGFQGLGTIIDKTGDDIKTFGNAGILATEKIEHGFQDAEKEAKDFNREVRNSESAFGSLKKVALGIGGIIAGVFAVDKIKDFGISAVESTANAEAMQAQFHQVFTGIQQNATESLNKIAEETGMIPNRLRGSFTQMAAFAKTTGMETADALSLTERATRAAADSAAFYDRSIEDVTENLQSFLKGNFENDAALGISATETTRNAAAMRLYGKEFKKLNEEQKQWTLLSMVEEGNKLSGALGQAARESDAWENQLGNLKQAWTDFKAVIGGPLLEPVVAGMTLTSEWLQNVNTDKLVYGIDRAVEAGITFKETIMSLWYDTGEVSDLWQNFGLSKETSDDIAEYADMLRTTVVGGIKVAKTAFEGLKTGIKWMIDNKDAVISIGGGLMGGFAAFKTLNFVGGIVKDVTGGIKKFTGFVKNAGGVMKAFGLIVRANPFGMIATGIGLAVTAGIYLWKNWDTVKEKTIGLWQTLKDNPMMALVAGPIGGLIAAGIKLYQNWDTIKERAGELWTKTKDTFTSFPGLARTKFGEFKQWIVDSVDQAKNKVIWVFTEMPFVVAEKIGFMVGASIGIASQLPSKFRELFGLAKDWAIQKISELPGQISSFVTTTKNQAIEKVQELATGFATWFATSKDNAIGIVSEIPGQIAGIIGQIPSAIGGIITSVYSKFKELGSSIPKAIGEGFTAAFAGLGKGVKWAFNKMVDGVANLKELGAGLASSFNEGVKKGGGISLDGSHATGLAKVPFDGYRAELHRNESILTARQSETLRGAGILKTNSDGTPEINLKPLAVSSDGVSNAQNSDSFNVANLSNHQGINISMPLEFNFSGNVERNLSKEEIKELEKALKLESSAFSNRVREVVSRMIDGELCVM